MDLKPENILLRDKTYKIADFGLAIILLNRKIKRQSKISSNDLSSSDRVYGYSPDYASPEQLGIINSEITKQSDIFSFGAILFEIMTGKNYFSPYSMPDEYFAKVGDVSNHLIKIMGDLDLPSRLIELVINCLAKNPLERPDTFRTIELQLKQIYANVTGNEFVFTGTTESLSAALNLFKAYSLDKLGCREQALTYYNIAASDDENYVAKCCALLELMNYKECIKACEDGLSKDPENSAALWIYSGIAHLNLSEFDLALKAYDTALDLDPNNSNAWYNKGVVLLRIRDYKKASNSFDKALDRDPSNIRAYTNKALILLILGDYEKAIECCDRALEVDPLYYEAHTNKAIALMLSHKDGDALTCLNNALKLNPLDFLALNNMGTIFLNQGNIKEALKYFTNQ
jgi:tetratricopeptide (TPR) repeat protein